MIDKSVTALGVMLRRRGRWAPLAFLAPLLLNVLYWMRTRGMVSDTDPLGFDLLSYRVAERALVAGECPYHRGVIDYAGEGGWNLPPASQIYPYANPPFFALFVSPLRALGHWGALAIWIGLALAATFCALRLSPLAPRARSRLMLVVALSPPVFLMLRAGQNTWLTLLLVSVAWALHQRNRYALSGVAIGMTALRPQWALPLALVWLVLLPKGRVAFAASVLVTAAALFCVGELAWPGSTACYGRFLRDMNGDFAGYAGFSYAEATALWGNLLAWMPRGPATFVYLVIVLIALALLWRATRGARVRSNNYTDTVCFALGMLFCLVISVHSSGYDWLLMLPAFVALWCAIPATRSLIVGWSAILMLVCYAGPLLTRAQVSAWGNAFNPSWPALALAFVSLSRSLRLPSNSALTTRD